MEMALNWWYAWWEESSWLLYQEWVVLNPLLALASNMTWQISMDYDSFDNEWESEEFMDLTELYDENDPWEELEEWSLEDIGVNESGVYKGDWE